MSLEARTAVLLLHLAAMVFMAAPLYMLIIVNERGRFPVPPGYNPDRYMENIIKGQPFRCYAYLAVIFVTGMLLVWDRGWVWSDWALIIKLAGFAMLLGLLSIVHLYIQPKIEVILGRCKPGEEVGAGDKPLLMTWRKRRKRLSAVCLFIVLTSLTMGIRLALGYEYAPWLAAVFVVAAAVFAWRVYRTPIRFGWL